MDGFKPLNLFGNEVIENQPTPSADDESLGETKIVGDEKEMEEPVEANEILSEENTTENEVKENASKKDETENLFQEDDVVEERTFNEFLTTQQEILKQIELLNNMFETRIMHTDHEEKIVDQMHKELQKYKEDMYAQLIRPILLDVIEVRDSIMRMTVTYLSKPEGEQSIPNKTFSDYAFDLQDILEKNSVEIYRSEVGDDFTPIKQRAVKKVSTLDENLHGKIAESLSCGYSYNGRTISAEKINVYFYEKPVEENENSEVIENG